MKYGTKARRIEKHSALSLCRFSLAPSRRWNGGSHLNAKQHTTLIQTQCALSNAARNECNTERKLNLAMSIGLKSHMQQFGRAVKPAPDYVTGRFSASSARLNSRRGCTFAETPLNAIFQIQLEPRVSLK
jgi:hypothetical protein